MDIEQQLGGNLPSGFPTIDKWDNGVATSIKSVDLRAPTYQDPAALHRVLDGYVDKVADFAGAKRAGVKIDGASIVGRRLEVAIPEGSGSAAQRAAIDAAASRASAKGVDLVVREIR